MALTYVLIAIFLAFGFRFLYQTTFGASLERKRCWREVAERHGLAFEEIERTSKKDHIEAGLIGGTPVGLLIDNLMGRWMALGTYQDFEIEVQQPVNSPTCVQIRIRLNKELPFDLRIQMMTLAHSVVPRVFGSRQVIFGKNLELYPPRVLLDHKELDQELYVSGDYPEAIRRWIRVEERIQLLLDWYKKLPLTKLEPGQIEVRLLESSLDVEQASELLSNIRIFAQQISEEVYDEVYRGFSKV